MRYARSSSYTQLDTHQNCAIFDRAEAHKFSYTECHQKFCKLIEDLLSKNLKEIGVTEEQFVAACAHGSNQEVNKLIFGQILAVDDFLSQKTGLKPAHSCCSLQEDDGQAQHGA